MDFLSNAMAQLLAVPDQLQHFAAGLSEEQLSWKPSAEAFSIRENILHLRDIDIEGYEQRIRLILNENNPLFPDINGAKLAQERSYNAQPIQPALAEFRRSCEESIHRLKSCSEADLSRTGEMQGIGRIDLRRLLQLWMQHDAEHLADLRELRRALATGIPGHHLPNTGLRASATLFRLPDQQVREGLTPGG